MDGPCMVLAGPGSGKTSVITYRTKYLIEEAGIPSEQILVITFTRAAAHEMQSRFLALMEGRAAACTFGTFHSVFFRILRQAYGYQSQQILLEDEKRRYIKEYIMDRDLELDDEEEFVKDIMAEITLVKSEYMNLDYYYSTTCGEELFREIYRAYESYLAKENRLDFDDILIYTYELLKERQDILASWQRRFPYILIDEFQDINRIQYEVVRLLSSKSRNLFIVGDDDQSIYRFRGARPEIMLGFPKDYPDARTITLNVNYRSNRELVEGSLRLIEQNEKRYDKPLVSARGYENPIYIHEYKTDKEENISILKQLRMYHEKGIPYREMAVIFRTNHEPGRLVHTLMEYNIPFRMRDRIPNLYDHFLAQHLIAYGNIAMGSRERKDFLMIWNRPKRYLRRDLLQESVVDLAAIERQVQDKDWAVKNLHKLRMDLRQLESMTPYAAIHYIRKGMGYDDYIREYAKERRMKEEELLDLLDEIQAMSAPYKSYADWYHHIAEYGEQIAEQQARQQELGREEDAVTLTTMHSAKGLEYEVVFVIEANEGITPYKKAVKPEDLEEERRMFYVAVTRSRHYLHISYIKERFNKTLVPSRYVNEIRFDRKQLTVGARVRHRKYGLGTVTYCSKDKISLQFEESGMTKTFSLPLLLEQGLLSS